MRSLFTSSQPAKKYFVTMFLVSCALLAVFTLVIYKQSRLNEDSSRWVIHSYEVLGRARNILIHIYDADIAARSYIATGTPDFLQSYETTAAHIDEDVRLLSNLTVDDPEQQSRALALSGDLAQFKQANQTEIDHFKKGGSTVYTLTTSTQAREKIIRDVRTKVRGISRAELDTLGRGIDFWRTQQHNYLRTLFVGAVLDIGALIIANLVIFGLLTRGNEVEEELRKSEERFRLLMHGINDGIFDRDLAAGAVYFSPACKDMLGYTDAEFPNTPQAFDALMHPDDVPVVEDARRRYGDHETPLYSSLFRMRHKDGGWRWILARGIGIWDEGGKIQRLVGTLTDITAQKEREEELKQLNADLEGFTYIASHDLRAPLVNLKGFSVEMQRSLAEAKELLDRRRQNLSAGEQEALDQVFDKDIPEAIGFIQSSVEKMDKLTGAILDLSRIGRREYYMQAVDTGGLVQRCLDALAYEIGAKEIEVTCETLPSVVSDPLALEQVFGNILDNAIKYLEPDRTGRIEIGALVLPTEIVFSVRDNGRGIGAVDEKKVFDIFRRAGNAGNIRGAGMGMAYVKATLRKLGGKIWFQSTPGIGTVFYVSLPILQAQREAA